MCLASAIFGVEPSRETERFRIVFASHRDGNGKIYVMDADGRYPKNLTNNPECEDGFPSCSPNGNYDIYVMSADGGNPINLTNHPALDGHPVWSPDSSKIAFDSWRDGNLEIYVMDADGSNVIRLTNNPAEDIVYDWSPDGQKIAFASNRDWQEKPRRWRDRRRPGVMFPRDMWEIYVMDANGRNQIRLTNNRADDGDPSFLRIVGRPAASSDKGFALWGCAKRVNEPF